jgi:dTMP kinase
MTRGYFIVFEGIEGVGKTTQIQLSQNYLQKNHIDVLTTREPGGTLLAEKIRSCVLTPESDEPIMPMTELLLIFAARIQHMTQIIAPALRSGRWVICDRYIDSTYAYQGAGRGIAEDKIQSIEKLSALEFRPDQIFLFDLPLHEMLRRKRTKVLDRIESETEDFFRRVRQGYLRRAESDDRYCILDACGTISELAQQIQKKLNLFIANPSNRV